MTDTDHGTSRLFVTYSGVKLPLKLSGELDDTSHRNTWFRGWYDADGRTTAVEKFVYGEIEMSHRYAYHAGGALARAEITDADGETRVLRFDEHGAPLAGGDADAD